MHRISKGKLKYEAGMVQIQTIHYCTHNAILASRILFCFDGIFASLCTGWSLAKTRSVEGMAGSNLCDIDTSENASCFRYAWQPLCQYLWWKVVQMQEDVVLLWTHAAALANLQRHRSRHNITGCQVLGCRSIPMKQKGMVSHLSSSSPLHLLPFPIHCVFFLILLCQPFPCFIHFLSHREVGCTQVVQCIALHKKLVLFNICSQQHLCLVLPSKI